MKIFIYLIYLIIIPLFLVLLMTMTGWADVDYAKETKQRCIHCHVDSLYPGGSFYEAESSYKWTFMWSLMVMALIIFGYGVLSKVLIWRRGKNVKEEGVKTRRLKNFFLDAVIQRGIWRLNKLRWVNYITLSTGFTLLFFVTLIIYVSIFVLDVRCFNIPSYFGLMLDILTDLFGLSVMVGVVISSLRRYIIKSSYLKNDVSDNLALVLIFLIVFTGFLVESFRIAAMPFDLKYAYSFVGFSLAWFIRGISIPWATYHFYLWNIHFLIAFAFIAYIPYGNFAHIFASPVSATKGKGR